MAGAILQGVPATTLDTDLWIGCPPREYMRIIRLALRAGAAHVADTVVELEDGSLVNFIYAPHGLRSFDREYRDAPWIPWLDGRVKVLPLARIRASKAAAGRPKDLAHLPLIDTVLQASRLTAGRSRRTPGRRSN